MKDLLALPNNPDTWLQPFSNSGLTPASLFSVSETKLIEQVKQRHLLLLATHECQKLQSVGIWGEILDGRVVITIDDKMHIASYIDSIPVFGYHVNGKLHDVEEFKKLFANAFVCILQKTKNFSTAIAVASEFVLLSFDKNENERRRVEVSILEEPISAVTLIRSNYPNGFVKATDPYLQQISKCEYVVEQAAVYAIRDKTVLMAEKPEHKALRPGLLYLPGGKLEGTESAVDGARRELYEETGLQGGRAELLGVGLFPDPKSPVRLHRFYQYVIWDPEGTAIPQDDIISCEWLPIDKIPKTDMFEFSWAGLFTGRLFGLF